MGDTLTIVRSINLRMTKVWDSATGAIRGYDRVRQVKPIEKHVSNIYELSDLLTRLEKDSEACILRGRFVGMDKANEAMPSILERDARAGRAGGAPKDGYTLRRVELFPDRPLHYFMIDIDGFKPAGIDPVQDPESAIAQYIAKHLPDCFQSVTFHWQLSSSAGHPSAEGILKAHAWFWLKTPQLGAHLKAWVEANDLPIDTCVFEAVQPNYTAAPIFANGVPDPVPRRSGLFQGLIDDEVDLVIPEETLVKARAERKRRDDMVDPSEKDNDIGLFCRTFEIEDVIERWLSDVFEFVTDERLTYLLSSSGAKEGARIIDNRQGIFNSHDSDPFNNRAANKWDLVRVYRFGDLDAGLSAEEKDALGLGGLPSQKAMIAFVNDLPEIKAAKRQEIEGMFEPIPYDTEISERDALISDVNSAPDENTLRTRIIPKVSRADLAKVDLEAVVGAVQAKLQSFLGIKPSVKDVREMLNPRRQVQTSGPARKPEWAKPWVFSTDKDMFYNLETRERATITGLNMRYGIEMTAFDDENGNTPAASEFFKTVWGVETVSGVAYMPGAGPVFSMLGLRWANTYSDADVPEIPETINVDGLRAINLFIQHTTKMIPDQRDREVFISWLAHNVKHPGKKIRWSPFISGDEGVGKSFFTTVLGLCMGGGNVAPLDVTTVCNSNFTDWAIGAAVRCMEEAKLHGHNAHDVMNKVKTFITNDIISVHPKGLPEFRAVNTTNYLIFSNYRDGLAITPGDRRYYVLHSAISKAEGERLSEAGYFKELFDTVEGNPGALRKWLCEYEWHPEFKANGEAPMTSAKGVTIEMGKTNIHVAGETLFEKGGYGISRDIVSSNVFVQELKNMTGEKIFTSTTNSLLSSFGLTFYDRVKWRGHPHGIWLRVPREKNEENNRLVRAMLDATDKEDIFQ